MEKPRPLLSVRPQFNNTLTIVQCFAVVIPGTFTATFLLGSFFFILFSIFGLRHVTAGGVFGFFAAASVVVIPPVFYELKKRAYQQTVYNFYKDYLEFQYFRFYLNRRRGRVRLEEIADVSQHATVMQEHQRLTTIELYIPNMGIRQQGPFAGLHIADVPRAQNYMTKIIDILEKREGAPAQTAAAPAAAEAPPASAAPSTSAPVGASPASPPPVTEDKNT